MNHCNKPVMQELEEAREARKVKTGKILEGPYQPYERESRVAGGKLQKEMGGKPEAGAVELPASGLVSSRVAVSGWGCHPRWGGLSSEAASFALSLLLVTPRPHFHW